MNAAIIMERESIPKSETDRPRSIPALGLFGRRSAPERDKREKPYRDSTTR